MSDRFVFPTQTAQDSNGKALAGALAYFYETGTDTLKDTYTDNAYTTPQSNPVVADSQGSFPSIFLQGEYRVDLRNSADVSQPGYPADNVFVAKFDRQSKTVLALTMTDSDITLTNEQFDNAAFDISGVLTANVNLIVPNLENVFIIDNETSGSFTITVKHAASAGIIAPQGSRTQFYTTGIKIEGVFSSAGGTFTTLVTLANGDDIASATTVDLTAATGNTLHITGTVTTTALTMNPGLQMELIADAAWPLTYDATDMNLNTNGENYTCTVGDRLFVVYDGTITHVNIEKQDGTAVAAIFTSSFTSAEQTITSGGPLTLAHGLGAAPSLIQCRLICKSAEANYSVDDELIISSGWSSDDITANRGVSIVPDATNLNVRFGNAPNVFTILDKTTGARFLVTVNWKFIVRAWA
ncbi:MAG: hypothetical protein KAS32_20300 [Candidatus Peribacteraceae bacterium]|nr:hypothetical protein [Candidatus Peribacteraceae bacterium]